MTLHLFWFCYNMFHNTSGLLEEPRIVLSSRGTQQSHHQTWGGSENQLPNDPIFPSIDGWFYVYSCCINIKISPPQLEAAENRHALVMLLFLPGDRAHLGCMSARSSAAGRRNFLFFFLTLMARTQTCNPPPQDPLHRHKFTHFISYFRWHACS